jgi:hypothetical protein
LCAGLRPTVGNILAWRNRPPPLGDASRQVRQKATHEALIVVVDQGEMPEKIDNRIEDRPLEADFDSPFASAVLQTVKIVLYCENSL